jgi:hypothetical protein
MEPFGLIFLFLTKLILGPAFLIRFIFFAAYYSILIYCITIWVSFSIFKEPISIFKKIYKFISLNFALFKCFAVEFPDSIIDAIKRWAIFMGE